MRQDLFGLLGADVFVKQADFALMFQCDGQKDVLVSMARVGRLSVGMVLFFRRIWVAIIVERRGGNKALGRRLGKNAVYRKLFDK